MGIFEIVILAAIGAVTLIACLLIAMIGGVIRNRQRSRSFTEEESEIVRELWEGFQRMEERVTNLETILLERRREGSFE